MPSEITGTVNVRVDLDRVRDLGVEHLDQYFGLWSVEPSRFNAMLERIGSMDLVSHVQTERAKLELVAAIEDGKPFKVTSTEAGQVAVIEVSGTLVKFGSSLSNQTGTVRLRRTIRQAALDPEVKAIMLRIDSPGGTVAGTADLAAAVAAAAQVKPVHAYVEDLTASAAFWAASQASRIVANNKTALVGSIGTLLVLYDLSGAAAQAGIRAVVIQSGKFKGAGVAGTEITGEQRDLLQELVDKTQAEFSAAIAAGRKLSPAQVEAVATGRVWLAEDAQSLGLIDGIESWDQALATVQSAIRTTSGDRAGGNRRNATSTPPEPNAMAESQTTDKPTPAPAAEAPAPPTKATHAEIKTACPGCDAQFVIDQLDREATVEQARTAWIETQQARLEAREKENEELRKQNTSVAPKAPGNKAVGDGAAGSSAATDADGSATERFEAAVADEMKRNGGNKARATQSVCKANPELREAYVVEHNVKFGRPVAA